jgi:hypothetical protein
VNYRISNCVVDEEKSLTENRRAGDVTTELRATPGVVELDG